ncbi:hypothetical protein SETIT_5G200500v2 [Setaria italica]|uniref:Cyanobacterial aminoacyl-tRNA synthetase CAAD domain-containing protein n=1 Tax=Setaria italica TaxID=4555 RepID=K3XRD8_SETIT|nr:hypothetical protein SETIT_5G200500v2 [Setaria italica]
MVAAAAAVRPVSLRHLNTLLRAHVPCGLTTSHVAAPFPHRIDSMKISQLQLTATRFSKENNSDEDDELLSELRDKLPGLLELVGLSYSGWFVYRYLLFQENRKELAEVIDDIKRRIVGDDD